MIPLSMRQKTVTFTDPDKVTWTFAIKTGESELQVTKEWDEAKNLSDLASKELSHRQFNRIVLGWSDPSGTMSAFPADGNPALLFTQEERRTILGYWHDANRLTPEQKKS